MTAPMTDEQRQEFLRSLRLPVAGQALVPTPAAAPPPPAPAVQVVAVVEPDAPARPGRRALPVEPDSAPSKPGKRAKPGKQADKQPDPDKAARKLAKRAAKQAAAEAAEREAAEAERRAARKRGKAKAKEQAVRGSKYDDERRIPAKLIEFTPDMVAGFDMGHPEDRRAASRMLFDRFKSPFRDPDRHAVLHERITEFIQQCRRAERDGGRGAHVRAQVTAGKKRRDLASFLDEHGVTEEMLARLLSTLTD